MNTRQVTIDGKTVTLSKVKSITSVGPKRVYDLEVQNVHNYYAGGINVHNCSYHAMLDEVGSKYGEELYKLKDSFVQYRHRKIKVYPAGPDKRILRGRTRLFASMDEIGWFPNGPDAIKLVKMNADEVYKSLSNSLWTVRSAANALIERGFDSIPTAYFINLSSPSSVRDKIMELVRKSQNSRKIYGLQLATWDANPSMPRKMFDEEFKRDPVGAMRDFGAQPPIANSPLISSIDAIKSCISTKRKNPIQLKYHVKTGSSGNKTRYASVARIKSSGVPSIIAIDAGYSNNSFACTVGHLKDAKTPVIDMFIEIQPLTGIPLNYTLIYKHVLTKVIASRNCCIITADRWNSLKILQDAEEDLDCTPMQYSLKYVDMVMFKDYIESKQFTFPAPDWTVDEILNYDQSDYPNVFKQNPVEHFILQCLTVQNTGTTVVKGDQLTDDIARSTMLCLYQLLNEKNREVLSATPTKVASTVNVATGFSMKTYASASGFTKTMAGKTTTGQALGLAKRRSL